MKQTLNFQHMNISHENRVLLHCLQASISGDRGDAIRDIISPALNWEAILASASHHDVAPLLYRSLTNTGKGHGIPQEVMDRLRTAYLDNLARNMYLYAELRRILETLYKNDVPVIFLKGAALAKTVYGDIGLRPMSDVDILVRREDLSKAVELLFHMGYGLCGNQETKGQDINIKELINTYNRHVPALSHPQGIQKLDIHWTIPDSPCNIAGLWERAKTIKIDKADVMVLSLEDLLLHLSLHTSVHHKFHDHGLKQLYDIAITIHRYFKEIDWEQLRLRAYEWRTGKYLHLTLRLSREILGANVPERILSALKPKAFNEKLLMEAKRRILFQNGGKSDQKSSFEGIPHLDKFHPDNNLLKRASFIFKRIFIPPAELASLYSLPKSSRHIYFYYFLRFISQLYHHIPRYLPFFLYLLRQRKESPYIHNLDLWLNTKDFNTRL